MWQNRCLSDTISDNQNNPNHPLPGAVGLLGVSIIDISRAGLLSQLALFEIPMGKFL